MSNRENEIRPSAQVIDPQSRIYEELKDTQISSARHEERLNFLEKIDTSSLKTKMERLERDVDDLIKFKDKFLIKLVYWMLGGAATLCLALIGAGLRYAEPINKLLDLLEKLAQKP